MYSLFSRLIFGNQRMIVIIAKLSNNNYTLNITKIALTHPYLV